LFLFSFFNILFYIFEPLQLDLDRQVLQKKMDDLSQSAIGRKVLKEFDAVDLKQQSLANLIYMQQQNFDKEKRVGWMRRECNL
jgi:tRNA splicing endonuclease